MTEQAETPTTNIAAARLGELREELIKANKRLAKAGLTERFNLIVGAPFEHTWTGASGVSYSERRVEVALEQPSLGYNGWTFVATLVFEEGGTVVRTVPGQACDYRPSSKVCDQCHTDRYRNETFVVRNDETGEYRQVGRNCLALFFGLKPALWVFSYNPLSDFQADEDPERGLSYGHRDHRVLLADIVLAAMAVSNEGRAYRPASFEGSTTKGETYDVLFSTYRPAKSDADRKFNAWLDAMRTKVAEMREAGVAEQVVEMVRNLKGTSEYAENARVLANSEYVDEKNIGIVASFAKLWANEKQYAAERKAKAEAQGNVVNDWYGKVGEKLITEGTVTNIREIEGRYGVTTLIEWLSTEGYVFKWFASGYKDFEKGQAIKLQGTIKDLEEYQGRKATLLTRCKEVV